MKELEEIVVFPINKSLDYILENHSSVIRFGDGEFDIIMGKSIPYQDYNPELADRLLQLLHKQSTNDLLVCLPDMFQNRQRYNQSAQLFWKNHFQKFGNFYRQHCYQDWYGSSFISRPYMDLQDKESAVESFKKLKLLWDKRDILVVEGETSRSGVGNDLFNNCNSLKRIICPSKNAYIKYDEILEAVERYAQGRIILLMLGPTAKILVRDLSDRGFQAIDIGHIDSEYEWYKMGATQKIKFSHKHTAEFNYDENINLIDSQNYIDEIVKTITIDDTEFRDTELISIILPVYNMSGSLSRCLDSILRQVYSTFEVILVNYGSTDGSGNICEKYAMEDERIRLFHEEHQVITSVWNFALEKSKGKYVTFVNPDDFLDESYLNYLYNKLRANKSDISATTYTFFNEEEKCFVYFATDDNYFEKTFFAQEWLEQEYSYHDNLKQIFPLLSMKLFRKSLFNNITFPLEDLTGEYTLYNVYLLSRHITFSHIGLYITSQVFSHTEIKRFTGHDIEKMLSRKEERLALLTMVGFNSEKYIKNYKETLLNYQSESLNIGDINLYNKIKQKIALIDYCY
ncbi:TPA: SP_1767 family glycosyltransferase [Streptococcus agalactiae]|nr:SP_1767 family glycosyltransferase [Streptococcus agalactiae]EPT40260.1 glycosyl transferase family 8 [Streptococcus agalactiae FSL C1-494]EPT45626.1 glycosyl transferase family 8 [Streptococcus agalactiae FSL S3-170]EPV85824.1 glycosyl transferase family 8 [Streptococcus agalactiae FSL C1-487]KLL30183.1 glycosyl transferase family 8 [Streptococcus agalactiae]KLL84189.1 glycosyl transferase family 8 [Streptococcus agalactiae]